MKRNRNIFQFTCAISFLIGVCSSAIGDTNTLAQLQPELVKYKIQYPPAMFKSYTEGHLPTAVRLNPKTQPIVRYIMAPNGVTNVARNKNVTPSDHNPVMGKLSYLTDGDKSGENGTILELQPGDNWLQIDLGESYEVYAVIIWHHPRSWAPRIYRDVIVQLAEDDKCTKHVYTIFNNDHDNSLGRGKGSDYEYYEDYIGKVMTCFNGRSQGQVCKYVRVWNTGFVGPRDYRHNFTQYVEVEVIGRPINNFSNPSLQSTPLEAIQTSQTNTSAEL